MPTGVSAGCCVVGDVVAGGLVQVAEQDLLVVQSGNSVDGSGLEHRLRGLERVAVLQRVLLERHRGELLAQALRGVLRRHEVERALEDVACCTTSASSGT